MLQAFDKHKFATQPVYYKKIQKIQAREQVVIAYREITKQNTIPPNRGYWTLCNKQPDSEGAEIVQLVKMGLIQKNQFYGVDYDIKGEGIIEFNKKQHPEAHWYKGDWFEVIDENYEEFNPALV